MDIMIKCILNNLPGNVGGMPIHNETARGWWITPGVGLKMLLHIFEP